MKGDRAKLVREIQKLRREISELKRNHGGYASHIKYRLEKARQKGIEIGRILQKKEGDA